MPTKRTTKAPPKKYSRLRPTATYTIRTQKSKPATTTTTRRAVPPTPSTKEYLKRPPNVHPKPPPPRPKSKARIAADLKKKYGAVPQSIKLHGVPPRKQSMMSMLSGKVPQPRRAAYGTSRKAPVTFAKNKQEYKDFKAWLKTHQ